MSYKNMETEKLDFIEESQSTIINRIEDDRRSTHTIMRMGFKQLKDGQDSLNKRVSSLEKDVKILKEDVKILKEDVKVLKEDMVEVKSTLNEMFEYIKRKDEKVEKVIDYLSDTKKEIN